MSQTMRNLGTSAPTRPLVQDFPTLLEDNRIAVQRALPKHISTERIMRIALTEWRRSESLQKCNPISILSCVVQAAQLGLEIGQNGEAFLVPFNGECQLVPGYKGLLKLVQQSGYVTDIYAQEVRKNDYFKQVYGLRRELVHEPLSEDGFLASDEERGPITGFYAVAVLKSGERTYVARSVAQINQTRDQSQSYRFALTHNRKTPWIEDYSPMALKTVIRAVCSLLPKSSELRTALDMDTAVNLQVPQSIDLQRAADGTYTPPNLAEAYENRPSQNQEPQPRTAARQPLRPSSTPKPQPAAATAKAPAASPAKPQPSSAPAKETSEQPGAGTSAMTDLEIRFKNAQTETEINSLYISAQTQCTGPDYEKLNFLFDQASERLRREAEFLVG